MMMRAMKKISAALSRRIRLAATRGILSLVSDAAKMQGVQVKLLDGETREGDRLQNYGFSSVPLAGAECVFLSLNGSRDQGVVIVADDRRYRLAGLKGGEVALYTDEGDSVILRRGNRIEVTTKTFKVTAPEGVEVDTPLIKCSGDIQDNAGSQQTTMREMRAIFDGHTHPGDAGGETGLPAQSMG